MRELESVLRIGKRHMSKIPTTSQRKVRMSVPGGECDLGWVIQCSKIVSRAAMTLQYQSSERLGFAIEMKRESKIRPAETARPFIGAGFLIIGCHASDVGI